MLMTLIILPRKEIRKSCVKLTTTFLYMVKLTGTMKTHGGMEVIVPCILNLGTGWRWVVSTRLWLVYPWGKSPWYPLDSRLGGPQSQYGYCGKEKKSHLLPCWESNPSHPAHSLVMILTELP